MKFLHATLARHGSPCTLLSDRRSNFLSSVVKVLAKSWILERHKQPRIIPRAFQLHFSGSFVNVCQYASKGLGPTLVHDSIRLSCSPTLLLVSPLYHNVCTLRPATTEHYLMPRYALGKWALVHCPSLPG